MAYKKNQKAQVIISLEKIIGKENLIDLFDNKLFLFRDNREEFPRQILIRKSSGKYENDSKKEEVLPYECFEEVERIGNRKKKKFQSFYQLKKDYFNSYCREMKKHVNKE